MPPLEQKTIQHTDVLSALNGIQASLDQLNTRMDAMEENVGFIRTISTLTHAWRTNIGCWARSVSQRQSRDFDCVMEELASIKEVLDEE